MNKQKFLLITVFYVSFAASSKFPLKDILHLSQDIKVAEDNYLCNTNATRYGKCCECTGDCMKYKTCCIDLLWNSTRPVPSDKYLDLFINVASQYKDTTCEPAFPVVDKNVQNNTSENILMVSTCLKQASDLDKEKCKHPIETSYESIFAVFGSDKYIYKNSFCARCNFIKHYQLLNLTAECTTYRGEHENPYQRFMNCFFKVGRTKITTNYIKTCRRNIFERQSACDKTNKYYKMCLSYLGVVGISANYHCFICHKTNAGNSAINLPNFACPKYIDESVDEDENELPWSLTINFAEKTNIETGISSMRFCKNGEIYNIISSTCERFSCSKGYRKIVNGCFADKGILQNPVKIIPSPTFDKCLIQNNITMIVIMYPLKERGLSPNKILSKLLNTSLPSSNIDVVTNGGSLYHRINLNIGQNQLMHILKTLTSSKHLTVTTIEKVYLTSLPSKDLKNRLETDFTKDFTGGRLCAETVTVTNISNNFLENCSYIFQNRIFDISNTNFLVEINKTSWKRKLISCSTFYLHSSCPLKRITNYTLFENKTLRMGNILYNASQYVPANGSIDICIPTHDRNDLFSSYEWHEDLSKALEYISFYGTIVSIVCYSIIITVYQFIKAVKCLPSAATVFQCVTLLLADTTFVVAFHMHRHPFGCKLIAIFLHWVLLAAQLWTAIIAFDISSKVCSVSATIVKTNPTRLAAYCITAYLIPTIIVSSTVLLYVYHTTDMSYGENDICFITEFYSKLYFYCIPLAAIYFITISLLVYTLYCIWIRENKARKILQNAGRRNNNLLSIAFKLILTLGLIEVLGFTQISKKNLSENEVIFNSVFAGLYTVLRSLRGLWLVLIYLCNRSKMKILKSIWRNNGKRPYEMRLG